MPSLKQFLRPCDIMDRAISSALAPHFLVSFMPPALLYHSALGRFASTVIRLMEQRLSVHIKLSRIRDYGIPQERSSLVVVAAPSYASPWHVSFPATNRAQVVKIKDLIEDLAFENPRTSAKGGRGGFVCPKPLQDPPDPTEGAGPTKYIYNHQTGRAAPPEGVLVDMDAHALCFCSNSPKPLVHPRK